MAVAPGNKDEPLIPTGKIPTLKPELALNPRPVLPRFGIVLTLRDFHRLQHGVPLFHEHRAQPQGGFVEPVAGGRGLGWEIVCGGRTGLGGGLLGWGAHLRAGALDGSLDPALSGWRN